MCVWKTEYLGLHKSRNEAWVHSKTISWLASFILQIYREDEQHFPNSRSSKTLSPGQVKSFAWRELPRYCSLSCRHNACNIFPFQIHLWSYQFKSIYTVVLQLVKSLCGPKWQLTRFAWQMWPGNMSTMGPIEQTGSLFTSADGSPAEGKEIIQHNWWGKRIQFHKWFLARMKITSKRGNDSAFVWKWSFAHWIDSDLHPIRTLCSLETHNCCMQMWTCKIQSYPLLWHFDDSVSLY